MHQPIQFNNPPKQNQQNHQKPANEVSKTKTPKNPTAHKYKPRNQTTTHDHQKITQHFPCNPREQQRRQKQNIQKNNIKTTLQSKKEYSNKSTTRNQHIKHRIAQPGLFTTNAIQQDIINQITQQKYI